MTRNPDLFIVHWVHVILGIYWFGSVIWTRLVLFPALATLPPEEDEHVRTAIQVGRSRVLTRIAAVGTVALGILRGLMDDVLDRLDTSYGATYLAAAALGIAMVVWLEVPWLKSNLFRVLYVAAFPVVFTLMVTLRFGGF